MTDPSTTTTNTNTNTTNTTQQTGLSKSQKKRMKAKASKARREAEEKERRSSLNNPTTTTTTTVPQPKTLNPHEKLRADLIALGFSSDEIDTALEEMWNLGLKYDEFDAVLSHLETKSRAVEEVVENGMSDGGVVVEASKEEDQQQQQQEEVTTISTAPSSSTTSAGLSPSKLDVTKGSDTTTMVTEEIVPEVEEQDQEQQEQQAAVVEEKSRKSSASSAKLAASPPPMGLGAKLDMVSNYENLMDSVFALTEWVTTAAKPDEITQLCNVQTTRALPTIIRRTILSSSHSPSSTIDLINAILSSSTKNNNNNILVTNTISSSLSSAILEARLATKSEFIMKCQGAAETIAEQTSTFVTFNLGRTLGLLKSLGGDGGGVDGGGVDGIAKLEEEIEGLGSGGGGGGEVGVIELMTRRDCHKTAAEKSGKVVSMSVVMANRDANGSSAASENSPPSKGLMFEQTGMNRLVSSMLGKYQNSISTDRADYAVVKMRIDQAKSSNAAQRNALNAEREELVGKRDGVLRRMEELRMELDRLGQESVGIEGRIKGVEVEIKGIDGALPKDVRDMEVRLGELTNRIKLGDAANNIAEKLQGFESSLMQASNAAAVAISNSRRNGVGGSTMTHDTLATKMDNYVSRMRSYFATEAECVEFMQSRVVKLENEAKELERDIEECAGLGMTTNVTQMSQSLKEARRNAADDNGVIEALRSEASNMRDDLFKRLDDFIRLSGGTDALNISVLYDIKEAITRIGLEGDGGLGKYCGAIQGDILPVPTKNGQSNNDYYNNNTTTTNTNTNSQFQNGLTQDPPVSHHPHTNGSSTSSAAVSGTVLPLQQPINTAVAAKTAVPKTAPSPPSVVTPPVLATEQPQQQQQQQQQPPPPPPPPTMPKFRWGAAAGAKLKAPPAKSFLDIQKEELMGKGSA